MIFKFKKQLVSGILALSLLTTSFGGAFAPSVFADTPDETSSEGTLHSGKADKGLLTGLAAVGLLAMLTSGGSSDNSSSGSKNTTPPAASPSEEQQALTLLNQDRAKHGLPALKANSQLTALARSYAQDMMNRGFFSHYNPEGLSPFDRMNRAGISYKTAGENLAINSSVAAAETAFMNSSGHRANILNSVYTDVGVGVVRNSKGQVYVVQEFISK